MIFVFLLQLQEVNEHEIMGIKRFFTKKTHGIYIYFFLPYYVTFDKQNKYN